MEIQTRDGAAFQIDDQDQVLVSSYDWYVGKEGYPIAYQKVGRYQTRLILHNLLLGPAPETLVWDHKNQDKLDNHRENIRAVTRSVNGRNGKLYRNNRSGIRGVAWYEPTCCWRVQIDDNDGRKRHIGYFVTIEEAATARKQAEEKYWGDQR
jgi:hypothetical protein